jgi:hypothetical protein
VNRLSFFFYGSNYVHVPPPHLPHPAGICYMFGTGVTKDPAEAIRLYTLAAEQGDARAQYLLGNCPLSWLSDVRASKPAVLRTHST